MSIARSISCLLLGVFIDVALSLLFEAPLYSSPALSRLKHVFHRSTALGSSNLKVEHVTICMGELCKCQEESSNLIMNTLKSSGELPFSIEESQCLGACGVGAMVSIEYDDGSYSLVTGLQETLEVVGLRNTLLNTPRYGTSKDERSLTVISVSENDSETFISSDYVIPLESTNSKAEKNSGSDMSIKEDDFHHDAIKRMREEARKSNDQNPWMNMALYLINKVTAST